MEEEVRVLTRFGGLRKRFGVDKEVGGVDREVVVRDQLSGWQSNKWRATRISVATDNVCDLNERHGGRCKATLVC